MRLNITATAGCRGKCLYCPEDRYIAAAARLPRHLTRAEFAALLPKLRPVVFEEISFGGFSEPFDNPEIVDLFELAQELTERLTIHTIGEHLAPDTVARMSHLQFDVLDISCHGFDAAVYARTRPFVNSTRVRDNVLYLLQHRANIRSLRLSMTGPFGGAAARAEIEDLCARYGASLDVRQLHSRAGLLRIGRRADRARGRFRCGKHDFEKPVLLPGGYLSLCCQDFALSALIGNLHEQSFTEIMERSPLRRHVLAVAAGCTDDPSLPCYDCEFCETVSAPASP